WDAFAGFTQGSRRRQPWAGRRNPFGVGTLLRALPRVAADGNPGLDDATPSGLNLNTQNSELSTQTSELRTQHSDLSTQTSALGLSTQHSALGLSTQHSALGLSTRTQHTALSTRTQHSELSTRTQHSFGIGVALQTRRRIDSVRLPNG